MSPTFFLTVCLGGIICLTPLAVYLFWLSALNRKSNPTVVSAGWDFTALLVGLSGFFFCLGTMLALIVLDSGFFTGGPFARLATRLPWLQSAWIGVLLLYLLLLARSIRLGLKARRQALAVFNVDDHRLEVAIDEVLRASGRESTRSGNEWRIAGATWVEVVAFPVFRHATVHLRTPSPQDRDALENEFREILPRMPAARDNPAAPWITAATTCCTVAAGCCVALIFALPFLNR